LIKSDTPHITFTRHIPISAYWSRACEPMFDRRSMVRLLKAAKVCWMLFRQKWHVLCQFLC